jgi:uncharacterized protein
MRERLMNDRVGLGWRGELSASILERLDAVDVLEVIAEDWLHAPRGDQRALRALAAERPLIVHGVALGLASSLPAEERRIDRMARLVDLVRPHAWSEHLAFVRAAGIEIGHLAAAPRSEATIEGTLANLRRASRIVGVAPAMENIATLVDPPASTMGEAEWTCKILRQSDAPMLLDLHNLYANALNFGAQPGELLARMPVERVSMVHLSGGRWLHPRDSAPRLLDDHLHDVPDPVFDLLEALAATTQAPLTVIIERDGRYPPFAVIVRQLERAREALAAGRRRSRTAAEAKRAA